LVVVLGALFVMLFALSYPYDGAAVLNPRYLLPEVTPMTACLGLGLAQLERTRTQRYDRSLGLLVVALTILAIGIVAALVLLERFGR
jgi:hypothetical protein